LYVATKEAKMIRISTFFVTFLNNFALFIFVVDPFIFFVIVFLVRFNYSVDARVYLVFN